MNKELEKSIKHVFDRAKEMGGWYKDETPHITKKLDEDIEVVKKALKRNEPMKPLLKDMGFEHYDIYCPSCKELEKKEKLLELYKKLSNLYEKLYTMELSLLSLNSNYYEIEIIKLKQQIKELEK